MQQKTCTIVVIGGGAAGYFGAVNAKANWPDARVLLLEATKRPLTKVKISGGGRCNVTHQCFDPVVLASCYPRGHRELRGPFTQFQPTDTVQWFTERGVPIKAEADGRMFPSTNNSTSIVNCLREEVKNLGVEEHLGFQVRSVKTSEKQQGFIVEGSSSSIEANVVLLATGSAPIGYQIAATLGHTISTPLPSLFTFNVDDPRLSGLAGVAFEDVELVLSFSNLKKKFKQRGPLLITHWGLSGPAVLKLSAWAAPELFDLGYMANLTVNFIPETEKKALAELFSTMRNSAANSPISTSSPLKSVPKRYWHSVVTNLMQDTSLRWGQLNNHILNKLVDEFCAARFAVTGKGQFKEEFVTCGGICRPEIDFKTMQSRLVAGLYFAGEVIDVDGITGGFNFQNAWTTAYIAAKSIAAQG